MQTPLPSFVRRTTALLLTGALVCSAGACSMPRIAGKTESEQQLSACESLIQEAQTQTSASANTNTLLAQRSLAAQKASDEWLQVAVQCPSRFSEAVLRSAQAQYQVTQLADHIGSVNDYTPTLRLDDAQALPVGTEALTRMALAEDRVGFALEVLAGRFMSGDAHNDNTEALLGANGLYDLSCDHKENASRMMHFATDGTDLRRKIYAVQDLIQHPGDAIDPQLGIQENTVAILEMTCAREELYAMEQYGAATTTTPTHSSDDATNTVAAEDISTQQRNGLKILAQLIASHAYTAFQLGYPHSDDVLFIQPTLALE